MILQGNVSLQGPVADPGVFPSPFLSSWWSMIFSPLRFTWRWWPLQLTIILFHSPGFFDMFLVGPTVRIMPP